MEFEALQFFIQENVPALTASLNNSFFGVLNSALNGNFLALFVLIGSFICFIGVLYLIYKFARHFFGFIKYLFIFIFTIGFVAMFFLNFKSKIFVSNPEIEYIVIGILGLLIAGLTLFISFFSFKSKANNIKKFSGVFPSQETQFNEVSMSAPTQPEMIESKINEKGEKITVDPETKIEMKEISSNKFGLGNGMFKTTSSVLNQFNDRSLLSVLAFIVVSEFGVFSGVTVSAPTIEVGIGFFVAFAFASIIFIKSTYHSYKTGLTHLIIAFIFAIGLSIFLGHFWSSIPLEKLISLGYFTSTALVASVSGVAVALFLGSKE